MFRVIYCNVMSCGKPFESSGNDSSSPFLDVGTVQPGIITYR